MSQSALRKIKTLQVFFYYFGSLVCGILVPDQRLKLCPLQQKYGVLTTGLPGNSHYRNFEQEILFHRIGKLIFVEQRSQTLWQGILEMSNSRKPLASFGQRDSGKVLCHQAGLDVRTVRRGLKTPKRAQAQSWDHRTWGQRIGVGTIVWMQKEEKYQGFSSALQASAFASLIGGLYPEARARELGTAVPCHTEGDKEGQGIDLRTNRQMISGDYTKKCILPLPSNAVSAFHILRHCASSVAQDPCTIR